MLILGSQRASAIERLQLPIALERLTRGESVHPELDFRIRKLSYSLEPEDYSPEGLDVIPLWEGECSITGFYYVGSSPVFVIWFPDELNSPKTIGHSVSDLVEFLVGSYGEDERELRNVLLHSS